MEALATGKDYIHLLCSADPKIAASEIVQIFKGTSAREISRGKPTVKKELWGGEFGQMATMLPQVASAPIGTP